LLRSLCRNIFFLPIISGLTFGFSMNEAMGQDIILPPTQDLWQVVLQSGGWPAACVLSMVIIARTARDLISEALKTGLLVRHEVALSKPERAIVKKLVPNATDETPGDDN
jgi:hypothetical protein